MAHCEMSRLLFVKFELRVRGEFATHRRVLRASSIAPSTALRWVFWASLVCGWPVLGCSLDIRHFTLPPDDSGVSGSVSGVSGAFSSAGASMSGAGRAGSATTTAGGGGATAHAGSDSSGGSSDAPPIIGGCVDLDRNGTGDCQETLVKNADFKSDVSDWNAELDATIEWDEHDAWPSGSASGSALVSSVGVIDANNDNSVIRAASQCVAAGSMQLVTAYANAFVDSGQDATGRAQIIVFFFDGEGCTGAFTNSFTTPQPVDSDGLDQWIELKAGSVTGLATKSVLVKLALSRSYSAASFHARFDNVLVKVQQP